MDCSDIGAIQTDTFTRSSSEFGAWPKKKCCRSASAQTALSAGDHAGRFSRQMWNARLESSRATLSKIEAQLRCVTDVELAILAGGLRVKIAHLYPKRSRRS